MGTRSTVKPMKAPRPAPTPSAPASPTKRPSKAAFARERDELAHALIRELDDKVFANRLPKELTIVWNGRLNTTAGRASWKKWVVGSPT